MMFKKEPIHIQAGARSRIQERKNERESNLKELRNLKTSKSFDWTEVEEPTRLAVRASQLGMLEEAKALLSDPSDKTTGRQIFEKIIAANNLLPITFLMEGGRMSRAVGRVVIPITNATRLGTGFMVSPRVMMTNNHVLSNQIEAGNAELEFDFYEREDGIVGPVTRFRLQPDLLFITDIDLDFTLVAVEAVNSENFAVSDRGWFRLIASSGKAIVGERVSIIQHPNGEPQQVSVHDNQIVDFNGNFIHYVTDTMGGSSGSPVLNINWDLVALHHAALGQSNEGIRISSIVSHLQTVFGDESAVTNSNFAPQIVADLMAGTGPQWISPDQAVSPEQPQWDHPKINPDGSASWVVPVTITLGVGASGRPNGIPVPPSDPIAPPVIPGQPLPVDNPELQAALQALEAADDRVFYSKVEDEKARESYYPNLDGLDGPQLFQTLSNLLVTTHTTTLSYKKARLEHLYPWIDRRNSTKRELKGIYSNKVFDALEVIQNEVLMELRREQAIQERIALESVNAIDEAFLEELEAAFPFNCEHVVPQSWFEKKNQPKADLHHLFTCEWGCNSFRGNRAYFDFQTEAFREDCGESEIGKFEPKAGKGAAARATLYFLLRYPHEIADSNKEMPKDRLATLIEWCKSDKVDRWEYHRNAEIQKVQGNRNPIIDFPELVDRIDFTLAWL